MDTQTQRDLLIQEITLLGSSLGFALKASLVEFSMPELTQLKRELRGMARTLGGTKE